jgi:hypothetical protein
MAIKDDGEWWIGSETKDIEEYLTAYTQGEGYYPCSVFREVVCPCDCDEFKLERASSVTQRTCKRCGREQYICRELGDWEEAVAEENPEKFVCVQCKCQLTNLVVGFAGYDDDKSLDAVKWFYVGTRCVNCGILGCFNEWKIGVAPASEVYKTI